MFFLSTRRLWSSIFLTSDTTRLRVSVVHEKLLVWICDHLWIFALSLFVFFKPVEAVNNSKSKVKTTDQSFYWKQSLESYDRSIKMNEIYSELFLRDFHHLLKCKQAWQSFICLYFHQLIQWFYWPVVSTLFNRSECFVFLLKEKEKWINQ